MKTNPFRIVLLSALAIGLLFSTACSEKPKKLTEKETLEIQNLNADGIFAMNILKDFVRAEKNYAAATKINDTDPTQQISLGMAQMRQGKKDDARKAYKSAMKLAENSYTATKTPIYLVERARAMALLGDIEGAVKALEKAKSLHPDDRQVKELANGLPRYFQSPEFRLVAILDKK